MAFENESTKALSGRGHCYPSLGRVIKRGGRKPDALAAAAVEQEGLRKASSIGREEHEQRIAGMISGQVFLNFLSHQLQGFLDRKMTINSNTAWLLANCGKIGFAVGIAVQQAVG